MISAAQVLDRESLLRLAGLRGLRWRCFGGRQVSGWMTDVSFWVVAGDCALTISGEVDDLDFEGEPDSCSRLRIDRGAADVAAGAASGRTFHACAGQEVRDVLLVRGTVVRSTGGRPAWTYTSDIAVVFALQDCSIAVARASHHSELLTVARSGGGRGPTIEEPGNLWADRPGVEHRFSRRIVPIGDLLDQAPPGGRALPSARP